MQEMDSRGKIFDPEVTTLHMEAIPEEILDIAPMAEAEGMPITTDEEYGEATNFIHAIAEKVKLVKKQLDFVLGPIDRHVKAIKKMVNDRTLVPLKRIDGELRESMGDYLTIKEQKRQAEERKRREEIAAKKREEADKIADVAAEIDDERVLDVAVKKEEQAEKVMAAPMPARSPTITGLGKKMGSQKYYEPEITDPEKVPDQYRVIDMVKINMIARSYGTNPIEIPGVVFHEKLRPRRG